MNIQHCGKTAGGHVLNRTVVSKALAYYLEILTVMKQWESAYKSVLE